MKFRELFKECRSYRKSYNKKELALKVSEESGELSKAVNADKEDSDAVKQEIGDVILAAIALYQRYDDDVETLKVVIGRKLVEKRG